MKGYFELSEDLRDFVVFKDPQEPCHKRKRKVAEAQSKGKPGSRPIETKVEPQGNDVEGSQGVVEGCSQGSSQGSQRQRLLRDPIAIMLRGKAGRGSDAEQHAVPSAVKQEVAGSQDEPRMEAAEDPVEERTNEGAMFDPVEECAKAGAMFDMARLRRASRKWASRLSLSRATRRPSASKSRSPQRAAKGKGAAAKHASDYGAVQEAGAPSVQRRVTKKCKQKALKNKEATTLQDAPREQNDARPDEISTGGRLIKKGPTDPRAANRDRAGAQHVADNVTDRAAAQLTTQSQSNSWRIVSCTGYPFSSVEATASDAAKVDPGANASLGSVAPRGATELFKTAGAEAEMQPSRLVCHGSQEHRRVVNNDSYGFVAMANVLDDLQESPMPPFRPAQTAALPLRPTATAAVADMMTFGTDAGALSGSPMVPSKVAEAGTPLPRFAELDIDTSREMEDTCSRGLWTGRSARQPPQESPMLPFRPAQTPASPLRPTAAPAVADKMRFGSDAGTFSGSPMVPTRVAEAGTPLPRFAELDIDKSREMEDNCSRGHWTGRSAKQPPQESPMLPFRPAQTAASPLRPTESLGARAAAADKMRFGTDVGALPGSPMVPTNVAEAGTPLPRFVTEEWTSLQPPTAQTTASLPATAAAADNRRFGTDARALSGSPMLLTKRAEAGTPSPRFLERDTNTTREMVDNGLQGPLTVRSMKQPPQDLTMLQPKTAHTTPSLPASPDAGSLNYGQATAVVADNVQSGTDAGALSGSPMLLTKVAETGTPPPRSLERDTNTTRGMVENGSKGRSTVRNMTQPPQELTTLQPQTAQTTPSLSASTDAGSLKHAQHLPTTTAGNRSPGRAATCTGQGYLLQRFDPVYRKWETFWPC